MDWPAFTRRLLLADGRISEMKAELLEQAVMEEGTVDKMEIEFLAALKREANWVHPRFDALLFRVLKRVVLRDGTISDAEALWLRKLLYADRQVVEAECEFVKELKKEARSAGPEFDKLHHDCTQLCDTMFQG